MAYCDCLRALVWLYVSIRMLYIQTNVEEKNVEKLNAGELNAEVLNVEMLTMLQC